MKINIQADKVSLRGPKIDGSFVISFEVGEYEAHKLAPLLSFKNDEAIKLEVEQDETV